MSAVVYVFPQTAPRAAAVSPDSLSGQMSADVIPLAPYRIQRDFPEQWQTYLHAHFDSIGAVALAFGVTERAARRWWQGAGPRGAFVVIALRIHPQSAPGYLLGAENMRVAA